MRNTGLPSSAARASVRAPAVIIGIGNPDRGDDAAGREVARRLGERLHDARCVELGGEATTILAQLEEADAAFLIDACMSGAPPGTLRRIDVAREPLHAADFGLSSHGFGPAAALELAKTLGILPRLCVVYAIEAQCFDIGAPLSAPVARAVDEAVDRLERELAAFL